MKRRGFLVASVTIASGFAIGYRALESSDGRLAPFDLEEGQTLLGPYVLVDDKGITIMAPRAEMGQGISTTLAALVAEELDVSLSQVRVKHGPATELYRNTFLFPRAARRPRSRLRRFVDDLRSGDDWSPTTLTGAQASIQDGFVKMRRAGAAARAVLVEAAARRLDVAPRDLRTRNGAVECEDGARISYVDLAVDAGRIAPPQDPELRDPKSWKLLGRSQQRVDMKAKCLGTAKYAIDVRLPGMLYGSVRRHPNIGGQMIAFDATKARRMPGVRKVIPLDDGIIVVASNTWYAEQAAKAVDLNWGPAGYPDSTEGHYDLVRKALLNDTDATVFRNDGDVDAALAEGDKISGEYRAPYLAHATMEPMNAVAWFRDGKLDIWAGNQFPTRAVVTGADLCGISRDDVRVHTTYMGCGFGRRLEMDFIETAVQAARALPGTPVSVTWTREEDMTHDVYRPLAIANFRASVSSGRPGALDIKVGAPPLHDSDAVREGRLPSGRADKFLVGGLSEQPYALENYRVSAHPAPVANLLPVGWWRSVGESQNSFFHESIVDELAHAAGVDPLEMRLDLLQHEAGKEVLLAAAEMSGWGSHLPEGHGRGVAFVLSSGAPTAQVIEVRLVDDMIEIIRACVAVDVGLALDPQNIEAQLHSSVIFGLTAAKTGEISVKDGRVQQKNFDTYAVMRIRDVPEIETKVIESGDEIFGVGEAATPSAAPALGNAIFAATGQRIRQLPFDKFIRFA